MKSRYLLRFMEARSRQDCVVDCDSVRFYPAKNNFTSLCPFGCISEFSIELPGKKVTLSFMCRPVDGGLPALNEASAILVFCFKSQRAIVIGPIHFPKCQQRLMSANRHGRNLILLSEAISNLAKRKLIHLYHLLGQRHQDPIFQIRFSPERRVESIRPVAR